MVHLNRGKPQRMRLCPSEIAIPGYMLCRGKKMERIVIFGRKCISILLMC